MISCIETALKPELLDAEAVGLQRKAMDYFNINIHDGRVVNLVTIEAELSFDELRAIKDEILTNPVIQISSLENPLEIGFDWCIWVGFRPGVRDNAGSTAQEAVKDLLKRDFRAGEGIYTSKRYCITGNELTREDVEKIAGELLANPIIQQWKVFSYREWKDTGEKSNNISKALDSSSVKNFDSRPVGLAVPKVMLNHVPGFDTINIESDQALQKISNERNLALNPRDIPVIRQYFLDPDVRESRNRVGLSEPTDVELEYISQARSDHCNHNTFRGLFNYRDISTGETAVEKNLFKTYIQEPTLQLKDEKEWVVSVLWDNAGVGRFDGENNYVITGETHNSPSNMEAYGGAITGIVGVYRDPLGTGLGSRLIMGSYGFCVGDINYNGPLKAPLHPRRLLDGVVEGVKDGGNKSGVPTTFGQTLFNDGYMGKSLVFVTALGIMPSHVNGMPSHEKKTEPGDLVVMSGGRVGKDGIHGVTASSEVLSENTPAGHVQIGDPYTQKKMHDFLLIARDEGLFGFITDNGGGGLSSSVGESAMISNGCEIWLDKVPLKYDGLDMWEIWVSESQERMTIAVKPEYIDRFMELSKEHEVESTVIGTYTDSGKLHILYNEKTCAYVDIDLLEKGFPQWEFDAVWVPPDIRGLTEPVLKPPSGKAGYNDLLCDMLARPNICSKEWIVRQYDHEVQGGSVIKPLVGINRNVPSDASVIRPVLTSERGIVFSQALLPWYSKIDAYHMMSCTIDEAVRRIIAVGGSISHIGGVDNFCWPDIQHHPEKNPDGRFKAAQLVRACRALKDASFAYGIPLLSGKDSMYVDGYLQGKYGDSVKVSALETVQFSATGVVEDIKKCITLEPRMPGDLVYVLGVTADELGASEYYELLGKTGLNVPEVNFKRFKVIYKTLEKAVDSGIVASAHAVARGGLGVHFALSAISSGMGMDINLDSVPLSPDLSSAKESNSIDGFPGDDLLLFSESSGRFIVTVAPEYQSVFEKLFKGLPCGCVGRISDTHSNLRIQGIKPCKIEAVKSVKAEDFKDISTLDGKNMDSFLIIDTPCDYLEKVWQAPMGGMV
ncbi:Phosphoribosylformylglycinamidine synthase [Desulfamplus magnetovallimortis]|uniref:Phosphoribosylformylglycinamidine synthase subunit PurL n=1 Tax=Desulfamplus magnetovallimortis TaxID=1246637 RepID=A0A1W1H4K3_9BACT|nr:phosphoribosylformylglycinamidine synthase subunit PurS [Desulfamplus magnetovallimortis]SLM27372.1 Phosphoribosylformylglycinamidine synthase [Desulfamplus magnetovallimortis]